MNLKPKLPQASPAAHLYPELLLLIFSLVRDDRMIRSQTLRLAQSAVLVCRSWNAPGTAVLYADVTIRDFTSAVLFFRTIRQNQSLGSLVLGVSLNFIANLDTYRASAAYSALDEAQWPGYTSSLNVLLKACPALSSLVWGVATTEPASLVALTPAGEAAVRRLTRLRILMPPSTCGPLLETSLNRDLSEPPLEELEVYALPKAVSLPGIVAGENLRSLTLSSVALSPRLPDDVTTCPALTHLSLVNCMLVKGTAERMDDVQWPCLPRLRRLSLQKIAFEEHSAKPALQSLLTAVAPHVRHLALVDQDFPVEFVALFVSLHTLELRGTERFWRIPDLLDTFIQSVGAGEKLVSFTVDCPSWQRVQLELGALLPNLRAVEDLTLTAFGPMTTFTDERGVLRSSDTAIFARLPAPKRPSPPHRMRRTVVCTFHDESPWATPAVLRAGYRHALWQRDGAGYEKTRITDSLPVPFVEETSYPVSGNAELGATNVAHEWGFDARDLVHQGDLGVESSGFS